SREPTWAGAAQRHLETAMLLLIGCLLTGVFFSPLLLLAKAPLPLIMSLQAGSGLVLLVWGKARLRAAVLSQQTNRPGALWMVFLGGVFLLLYLPAWLNFPGWLTSVFGVSLLILCSLGQYWFMQHWKRISQKRHPGNQKQ